MGEESTHSIDRRKEDSMRIGTGLLTAIAMLMAAACATTPPPPPPSVDVSGNWAGTWQAFQGAGGNGTMWGTFRQEGATVRGDFTIVTFRENRTFVAGSISGNVITLEAPNGGRLEVNGDEIAGVVYGIVDANVRLTRQR
jgi:hypothetical protein